MNIRTHWRRLLDHAFNPCCAFCYLPCISGHPLCERCHAELPWLLPEQNQPLANHVNSLSAFAYQPPISNLLLGIKFGKNLHELATLGELTATGLLPQLEQIPEAILPVPLHVSRLHKRGFNQALELVRPLAKQLGAPLLTDVIRRSKATRPQTELDSAQRQHNLRQAFQLDKPLRYKRLAIFDDVITTGATARELVALLQHNGAEQVEIWSCARAILRQSHELMPQIDYH